jgi:hypothetical protein
MDALLASRYLAPTTVSYSLLTRVCSFPPVLFDNNYA